MYWEVGDLAKQTNSGGSRRPSHNSQCITPFADVEGRNIRIHYAAGVQDIALVPRYGIITVSSNKFAAGGDSRSNGPCCIARELTVTTAVAIIITFATALALWFIALVAWVPPTASAITTVAIVVTFATALALWLIALVALVPETATTTIANSRCTCLDVHQVDKALSISDSKRRTTKNKK
jgi:hypothetical protein